MSKPISDDAATSDNEFYDACDKLDSLDLNNAEIEEDLSSGEEDDFQSIRPSLNHNLHEQEQKDKPFIPLHEQLNNEKRNCKIDEMSNSDDESPIVEAQDPFYVDEAQLKEEDENLTEEQRQVRLKEALEHKQTGNELFKEEKFTEALEFYTKALRVCPVSLCKDRSVFYSNRSVCYFKLKEYEKCINECSKSIDLDPGFVKPVLRRAECYLLTDKLEDALEDFKRLSELEPKAYSHKQKCFELEEKIKERNEKLKEEMMGKLKDLGNMVLKPFGLSTSNFQFVQDPNSGSYSVNFKKD